MFQPPWSFQHRFGSVIMAGNHQRNRISIFFTFSRWLMWDPIGRTCKQYCSRDTKAFSSVNCKVKKRYSCPCACTLRSTFSWPRHLLEVSGQLRAPAALPAGKVPSTHWIGGWVGPRAGLDYMEKWKFLILLGLGTPTCHLACSQSLTIYTTAAL
jgi:hypothetical protein